MAHSFKTSLLATAGAGILLGATVLQPPKAHALFGTSVAALIAAVNAVASKVVSVGTDVTNMQNAIEGKLQSEFGYTSTGGGNLRTTLQNGFNQNANYAKAAVGANEQIVDGALADQATQNLQNHDISIQNNHVLTPQACNALTNGQSIVVGSHQTGSIANDIESVTDPVTIAAPGDPSYNSISEGVASINALHDMRYCSPQDIAAGLHCNNGLSPDPDADQAAASLLGVETYPNQTAATAANDYSQTLIEPYAPAALRGTALTSLRGQFAIVKRRQYNAQMSLARRVATDIQATRTPSVELTASQQAEQTALGMPQTQTASWLGALTLAVDRRESSTSWHTALESDPNAKAVLISVADELAQSNYIELHRLKSQQQTNLLLASLLADKAQVLLPSSATLPTPQIAANSGTGS
ncbi:MULTISPECIES: hypothetical protein [Acidiphilium]|uniref:Uncharacterized protein n=1 Tax=Acidiphilium rubrum TaxID=526 RepID=A0A8G2CMS0_ACIRU|nr:MULTISPECIES: hypothetical protein [Acidiphilium]SIR29847.1 hypothetical protein SAMN05421828_12342 [Acidiphilium rubrum]